MREEKKSERRNLFIALTRGASEKEIRKKEEDLHRSLTRKEKKQIILKNARKARKTMIISILSVAIGGTGIYLTAPKNDDKQETAVESTYQTDKENKNNDGQSFRESIDARSYVQSTKTDARLQEAIQEVNSLDTAEDVLDYLKDIYVTEYNEDNATQITKENVEIHVQYKLEDGKYSLYNDVATNGDPIVRWSQCSNPKNTIDKDFIMTEVLDENKQLIDRDAIVYGNGVSQTAYISTEQVDKYEDGTLVNIGNLMRQGLCYYSEMDNNTDQYSDRAKQAMAEYKEDFINAVTEYNSQKENEDVKGQEELGEDR